MSPNEWIIDDATLLHIVSHTNQAELMNGDCTTEGIRKAAEVKCRMKKRSIIMLQMIRKSPVDSRSLTVFVSKSVIDNLDNATRNFIRVVECQSYWKVEISKNRDM